MRALTLYGLSSALAASVLVGAPVAVKAAEPPTGGEAAEAAGVALAVQRAADTGVKFTGCPQTTGLPLPVKCGWVSVPLDYAKPNGTQLLLRVSRVQATGGPDRRQGALVYNPGGPGASGLTFPVRAIGRSPLWSRVARAYDLVGYDPRGVGQSSPISCGDTKPASKSPAPDPTPTSNSDKQRRVAQAKQYAAACYTHSARMLPQLTTPNNARDLDVIRAALGEQRLNFLGASYGTYIGSVYATLFPGHVRRMVLDSAVNPDPAQIWYQNNLDQNVAFESRWADWRAWVARHDSVYHLGRTPGDVLRSYEKVRGDLATKPAAGRIGPGNLHDAVLKVGYYDVTWPVTAQALADYVGGSPDSLVKLATVDQTQAATDANTTAVYTAVECADASWPTDFSTWDADNTRVARVAPFETWDNAWMNLPCAFWKSPHRTPIDVRADFRGSDTAPVMIISAERDAATPYNGAVEMHRRLAGSVLVTERDAGSHGVTDLPNRCVQSRVDSYLLYGESGSRSASCPAHPLPLPRPQPMSTPVPATK